MSDISVLDKGLSFKFVLTDTDNMDQASEEMQIAYERWTQHVGTGDEKIMSTSDVRRLPKTKLDKKQVFIFDKFSGAAFEHVRSSRALLIGPRCLTSCLVEELTIPFITAPILNLAMRDMVITPSGVNVQEKARIKELVNFMGAQYLEILTVSTTHLVSNTVKSEKYEKAGTVGIKIMHPDWIEDVFKRSQHDNILASHKDFDRHRLPIFYGLEITSTNLTADVKNRVKNAVENNGGRYTGSFKSETTNVLVLNKDKAGSEKFQAAVRYKKDCVTPEWILDSVEKGYSLPIGNYKVAIIKVSTPTKVDRPPNASQFNPDCTQLSEISHVMSVSRKNVDETVNSTASSSVRPRMPTRRTETRKPEPEYKEVITRLTLVKAKKAGAFLDGCNIYLCGFSNDEKEFLNKILNIGGATRIDEVDERVSHVIIGEEVVALGTMKAHNLNPILVLIDWLEASMNAKQPVAEDPYLLRAKTTAQKEPEQPSPASKKNLQSMNHSFKRPAIPKFNLNEKPAEPVEEEAPADDIMGNYLAAPPQQLSVGTFNSEMYTEGSQVPFLEGKTVYIEHLTEAEYQSLAEECESAGGQMVDAHYQSIIDYVIVPFSPIDVVKVSKYRHIVTDLWWEETFKSAALVPVEYFHGPIYKSAEKPLANFNIVISTYTAAERLFLIETGTNLGATVKEQYIKKEKPILLCPVGEGAKYQAALKWKYPVVNNGWLLECATRKAVVPLDSFVVGDAVTCLPNTSTQSNITARAVPEAPAANVENIEPAPTVNLAVPEDKGTKNTSSACSPGYLRRLIAEDEICSQQLQEREAAEAAQASKMPAPVTASTPVVRHKRISQLNPKTPITPSADSPVTTSNISELVAELPTPNRSLVYKTLKEFEGKETPQSKRLKRLLATPGAAGSSSDEIPTPKVPAELKTPSAKQYGFREDASPDTIWMHKRRADAREAFYRPPKEGAKKDASPTLAQIKKKFWKNALGEDYVDSDNEVGAPHTEVDDSEQMENSPKRVRRTEPPPVEKDTPPTTSRRHKAATGIADDQQDNVKRLSEFLRNIRDDDKAAATTSNLVAMDSEPVRSDYEIGTANYPDIIGWCEPNEQTERREVQKGRSKCPQPVFSFSGTPDDARERLVNQVLALGGEVSGTQNYDEKCTHILCEKPSRGEKIFSGIAGGKWVLSTKYVEACTTVGYFLDEEEFEWGNPKALALPHFDGKEKDIAQAVYRWRSKISHESEYRHGVFTDFRVILVVSKMDQFSRLLRAGGAVILDVSPPYEECAEALTATHCFVDEKKSKLSKSDYRTLCDANIPVMSIMFLNSWLTSENSEPDRYLVSVD